MQMQMFAECRNASAEMLSDRGLRRAIAAMRDDEQAEWPFVESIGELGDRRAWAVDDRGVRFVVVGGTVFDADDLAILNGKLREAAKDAFARLDAGAA
ncbi:hypothetical protein IVB38_34560 [Bradyrhizobium sp. 38]|uniref:hypothetical protein n=1 Tax=unclassified Bradyrhizobium TaxID=2631580 RepID=UPI001FF99200|nr:MULTISPECIES: hypothetical protein [unclassified Bradyrhizobium]MCK1341003.1 hypothetical protein [Bradyrhizobium sp. 38]MCK1780988.1 hypothetical protein [Bradyrhizobium sp. 132]